MLNTCNRVHKVEHKIDSANVEEFFLNQPNDMGFSRRVPQFAMEYSWPIPHVHLVMVKFLAHRTFHQQTLLS